MSGLQVERISQNPFSRTSKLLRCKWVEESDKVLNTPYGKWYTAS